MSSYVLAFQDIDDTKRSVVGGKGANLGELSKLEGLRVPDGFCITTAAFQRVMGATPALDALLAELATLTAADRDAITHLSAAIRRIIEGVAIPEDISAEIAHHLARLGAGNAYAVRSSATAEDLPTASFAGQQDTYLNVSGAAAILQHVSRCWASLFTERAVIYRLQNGFDHRQAHLAVVVQRMVFPQASGILFTADPVTSNRRVLAIEASFGLGEALVSGLVNADTYKVRAGALIEKQVAVKKLAIYAQAEGGVSRQALAPAQQTAQALSDAQIAQLARIGRAVEAHFGQPQDIEWCLADDRFYLLQSRPITTLYPIPQADDLENHVYVSVGHQQMMTDPIKPLGLSFYLMTTPAPMRTAGGRLFVDVTRHLASADRGRTVIKALGQSDPLIKDALMTIVRRKDFIQPSPDSKPPQSLIYRKQAMSWRYLAQFENNPAVIPDLIERSQAALAALQQTIQTKSGAELVDFIAEDVAQLRKVLYAAGMEVVLVAMYASAWLNRRMLTWLGEKNAADTLSQSAPNNITSQMGLALLDLADAMRPYPEVIDYLQHVADDDFLAALGRLEGGPVARDAINAFLSKYGMRCVGEIDITRPRWREKPTTLVPMILSNISNFAPGESGRRFAHGRQAAMNQEQALLERLQQLPDGERKARETQRMIALFRGLIGHREYPKYVMSSRYFIYKQALLREAERLVQAGVIREREDIYYLTFGELREVVGTQQLDATRISQRKAEYEHFAKLTPPRVITSDGEIITGRYKRKNLPTGALAGLPVSSGVIEGRARVILRMEDADLTEGDILVTAFTDPSWTPLFVSVKGLVTEVGGLMTHGAVIAREYGLPAVVGVERATTLIEDGARIRVNGTEGYVEIL